MAWSVLLFKASMAQVEGPSIDNDYFASLYSEYRATIERFITSRIRDPERAQELTQDVFVRGMMTLPGVIARGNFNPQAYFYQSARYACIDESRKGKTRTEKEPLFQASFLSRTIDPEKSVVQNDVVSQVLDKLTAQQKSALVLRECHGFKYAEISDILGINNNALKQLLIRARRSFRRQYTQMYPPSEG